VNGPLTVADAVPEGYVVLEVVVSMRALDGDGEVCLLNHRSGGLTPWDALGMLITAADDQRTAMQARKGS
jgi:hypothetical protein